MKFSEQWIREWVNPPIDTNQLAEQLTMAGLEVETVEKVSAGFSGVVVAHVESVMPHPNADGLKVCQVRCGGSDTLTVVCGADNVRVGMRVPLARVGAKLPGKKSITAMEIKGVKSDGILCSAVELGLVDGGSGLLELQENYTLGQDVNELFTSDDTVIELSLTPNRGDCLSIAGVAREVSVLNNCSLNVPYIEPVAAINDKDRKVKLDAPQACPHYVGRVIEDVDNTRPLPLWLTERLSRSGLHSINTVVDITNYVMLELGQPLHAFNNDKLKGSIHVRFVRQGEKLVLLDNKEYTLYENTLVIADDKQVLAMAGIMGGLDSAVNQNNRAVFLESAYFNPQNIIGYARRYGLNTDSAQRFERGVDYALQRRAVERATRLILDICGGSAGPVIEASANDQLPAPGPIILHAREIKRILGISIEPAEVTRILKCLGMELEKGGDNWQVRPPSYRFDIAIETDLIEEIARIFGYNAIPVQCLQASLRFHDSHGIQGQLQRVREVLVQHGYQEVITYSFVDKKLQGLITPDVKPLVLTNPISAELSVMRTSLWPGLLQTLQYNLKRQQQRGRLFEIGLIYMLDKNIRQLPMIGGLIYGNIYDKQWDNDDILCDFFDIKGDLEGILSICGCNLQDIEYRSTTHPALHPGQSAEIILADQYIGYTGALHPAIQMNLEIPQQVYMFELQVNGISTKITPKYRKLSKFPTVRRDLAIVVKENIPVADIMRCIRKLSPEVLINLELFDVYQGEGIDLGKKSLALGLTFQKSSSTLIDKEVEAIMGKILNRLRKEFDAILRE
ncbi:MAG: phenylalanine--tRNA ligase subunit beta [Gammaproteobacteria bacterium]|nr:phenylalanine--tRNA ligase subunit beta [Gammaproteobacteria bacterium]